MDSLLVSVNWEDVILVGSALGIFTGSKYMHGKIARPKPNGNSFNKDLCDERHKVIDQRHQEVKEDFQTVFTKLDKIMDHLVGK